MMVRMMVAGSGQRGGQGGQFVAVMVLVLLVTQILIERFDLFAIGCIEQFG